MKSVITGKLCLPQGQLQLKCNLWCRNTERQVYRSLAAFCSDYLSAAIYQPQRQGFASVVRCNSKTDLHFFHEVFNFLT